ncbi:hypothetical protein HUG15_00705 [Salicibibacter cibarius]|uniref:Uncharacterized protein n=1 Tax=Salicibibacter cibarius TaxID=2743000 RepID=A0A7T6YZN3_9BACI|nr:hypothetical protein HUG15_00705 [Salicibibacter cibarius]
MATETSDGWLFRASWLLHGDRNERRLAFSGFMAASWRLKRATVGFFGLHNCFMATETSDGWLFRASWLLHGD